MIIVTGAAGFIGSNLVADLNAQGRSDLLLVDDLGQAAKWKNIAKRRFLDLVPIGEVPALLERLPRADAVFHMGADSSTTATDGDDILRRNLRSTMRWWEWCTQSGTPFIYASSAATYGDGALGFDDDNELAVLERLQPMNLYGWSKHAFDKWALQRASEGKAPPSWAGLKFFNVYGPNEYHKGEMKSLVAKNTSVVAAGAPVKLFKSYREGYDNGGQLRDFVYVKDCCNVMMWMMQRGGLAGVFNLGTGRARSFVDLVQAIGGAAGKEVRVEFVDMPESIRNAYQYYTQARMTRLAAAGYSSPFRSLEDGVGDYVRNHLLASDPYR